MNIKKETQPKKCYMVFHSGENTTKYSPKFESKEVQTWVVGGAYPQPPPLPN
jgi:hypothetical protein